MNLKIKCVGKVIGWLGCLCAILVLGAAQNGSGNDMPRLIVPIVTPKNNGKVDAKSLAKLIKLQRDNHISAFFVLGTTGEFNLMTFADKKALLDSYYKIIGKYKEPLFSAVGISAPTCTEMLRLIKYCKKKRYHVDAYVIAPLFGEGKPEEKVSLALKHTTRPILLYNNPTIQEEFNLSLELIEKFRTNPQIMGIKDSSGKPVYFEPLLQFATAKFHVYQGSESNLIADLKNSKITGIVSGTANVIPIAFFNLVKGIDVESAHQNIVTIKNQLIKYPSYVQGLKALLSSREILSSAETFDEEAYYNKHINSRK